MVEETVQKERRRHPRMRVNPDVFVFSSAHPGRICDISLGGMGYTHVYDAEHEQQIDALSIFDKGSGFFLEDVACRMVGSYIEKNSVPCSFMPTIRKNIQFTLSELQEKRLKQYLTDHALGLV